jgi:transposase
MPSVLGFAGVVPEATGRRSHHPATPLKIYLYGYLNQVQPSRRLERETRRNLEVMWLTGRLTPDFQPASPGEPRNDGDEGDHASLTRR